MNANNEVIEKSARKLACKAMAAAGLSVSALFVPFSVSRSVKNRKGRSSQGLSLNWRVTLLRKGAPVYTTDYSAGVAHCPSYSKLKGPCDTIPNVATLERECETGRSASLLANIGAYAKGKEILPDTCDVVNSLLLDGSAIDARDFADWASEYGYDSDSIKARGIYDECLKTGLALRAALGEKTLGELREAFQDF